MLVDAQRASALDDFVQARRQADLQWLTARMTGRSIDLLNYEDVRRALKATTKVERGLQEIELDAIVGSVGRYTDFTRNFLPRSDSMRERWARVRQAATSDEGWPPVQLYKVGDAYFVLDGNHRVSVARTLDMATIQAYVTEVITRIPLSPDVQPDDLIIKARYADFLEQTKLDELRPGADLSVTAPGAYRLLIEHIEVHHYYMGLNQQRPISYAEAVGSWYDHVYMPIILAVRERGILHDFPERTETDLYIWLSRHRAELQEQYEWEITTEDAITDLVNQQHEGGLARLGELLVTNVLPQELQSGPEPGEWRKQHLIRRYTGNLFTNVLVPVNGDEGGWCGLEQALVIAQKENSYLRGLHIVPTLDTKEEEAALAVQSRFAQRCQEAGVQGSLILETGNVANLVCDRARWSDLVVINLTYPPGKAMLARLGSGFHQIVQRSPRPILAVPRKCSPLQRALLAYDGSAKAEEALFLATYLAEQWHIPLVVVIVQEKNSSSAAMQEHVQKYLSVHEVTATMVIKKGKAAKVIQETAVAHGCDFIIMGGYGARPVVEVVLGSTANDVLRRANMPVLICQ
ncbi:MAG: universal stress protein [Anaerolineales bacterium]|nr:universal stress protein [Anaerolineales bacterium]